MENKLYRARTITHPSGEKFETPLLVPSFSSKGFSMVSTKDKGIVSECYDVMIVGTEFIEESLLVSAYDLYYKLVPKPNEFKSAGINIIDSGGYETSQIYDLSGINKYNHNIKEWDEDKLNETLKQWPAEISGIIVSYDHGELRHSIDNQIENAKNFFNKNKDFMSNFLIKPETKQQGLIQMPSLISKIGELSSFDIIGVTEKEIGNSQLERMINISKLRRAMDNDGISSPIHIFGSLDPINVILYFLAGAEIFDGLTWLKFAYHEGAAIYIQNYSVLSSKYGIETKDISLKRLFWVDNLTFLTKLKNTLINFNAEKNYSFFKELDSDNFNLSDKIEKLHIQFLNKIKSN